MDYLLRSLTIADEATVWEMLMYAAHEDSLASVRSQPELARYAKDWGRAGDLGWVAEGDKRALGAAWLRLWSATDRGFGYIDALIPELAIAVLPDRRGLGIGTQLLRQAIELAQEKYPAISLSVRAQNPVVNLYKRTGFRQVPGSEILNRTGDASFTMICQFD